jgi:poly(A) polymerase
MIQLPPEMTSSGVRKIFKALGGDTAIRFVGGCVRNAVLGEAIGDIDLATILPPQDVTERLTASGIKVVPTGIDHGTVTAVIDRKGYEITTLRRDVKTDGRRAIVAFTDDWAQDASRRDFTMNTLLADLEGHIYDPLGRGLADLKKGKVIFVGDPRQRIAEDYLRILRFFRFHAQYGKGEPDEAAVASCRAAARKLKTLSKERVTQELLKILAVPKSPQILTIMRNNNLLSGIISSLYEENMLNSLIKNQNIYDEYAESARLLVVCGLKKACILKMESGLRLPVKTIARMRAILDALKMIPPVTSHSVKLGLYRYGRDCVVQALYIAGAAQKWINLAKTADIPVFPLTGKDLLKAGLKTGPDLGVFLKRMEKKWIESGFRLSKVELQAEL